MLALLPWLFACSGGDFNFGPETGKTGLDDLLPAGTLRVDVYPSADGNNLLPQSFLVGPTEYGEGQILKHSVAGTVVFSGTLSAEVVQGWNPDSIGSNGPLQAVVRADRDGFIQSSAAHTVEDGSFSFGIPGNQSYSVVVAADNAAATPLAFFGLLDMATDRDLTETIAAGTPVYGRVTDAGGIAIAGVPLLLRDVETGISSATFSSDGTGWYVARAEAGRTYALESIGTDIAGGPIVPGVSTEFDLPDAAGLEVDLDLGQLDSVDLQADIVQDDGSGLGGATVRLTSTSLEGSDGSIVLESTNQGNGGFGMSVLPGRYRVEVWPDSDRRDLAPVVLHGVHLDRDTDLGEIILAQPVKLTGRVENDGESSVSGAIVTATQVEGGEYSFSTTTDADGQYTLALPDGDYQVQVVPENAGSGALASERVLVDGETELLVNLEAGTKVEGTALFGDAPVAYALVEIQDPNTGTLLAQVLTDANGAYSARVSLPEPQAADTGSEDTGSEDTGSEDTGTEDTGTEDTGAADTGR